MNNQSNEMQGFWDSLGRGLNKPEVKENKFEGIQEIQEFMENHKLYSTEMEAGMDMIKQEYEGLKSRSENEMRIIRDFQGSSVREDHYDGKHTMYKYSADTRSLFGKPIFGYGKKQDDENLEIVLMILNSLKIRPSRIFVYRKNNEISIDWYPYNVPGYNTKEEYFKASLEFARYVDSIKGLDLKVQTGMFQDDPSENSELSFNKRSFDRPDSLYDDISVMEC